MPNVNNWLTSGEVIDEVSRAIDAWRRIGDKPSSIVIKRGSSPALAAQTVRIEFNNDRGGGSQPSGGAGTSALQNVIIFGVRDHPTVADTNIQREDRFVLGGVQYKVVSVILTLGEIQAQAEAYS